MNSIMSFLFVLWCGTSHCQENLDFRREPVGCSGWSGAPGLPILAAFVVGAIGLLGSSW